MTEKKEIIVKKYKRNSISAELGQFCNLQKEHAFIEAAEWHNSEGFDFTINEKIISLTHGEVKAIKYLTKKLLK